MASGAIGAPDTTTHGLKIASNTHIEEQATTRRGPNPEGRPNSPDHRIGIRVPIGIIAELSAGGITERGLSF